MKRKIIVFFIPVLMMTGCTLGVVNEFSFTKEYEDLFSYTYPGEWGFEEYKELVVLADTVDDYRIDRVFIISETAEEGITLDDYFNYQLNDLRIKSPDSEITETGFGSLQGTAFQYLEIISIVDDVKHYQEIYILKTSDKFVLITFASVQKKGGSFWQETEKILESFEFL